ncbi:MAG: alpha/beta hydrolase [Chlamydiae bacterium]|nr:alpha/beta hydrolase [Chlamydiota bacterium]
MVTRASSSSLYYQARWNTQNENLQDSLFDKVSKFFFSHIHRFLTSLAVPSTTFTQARIIRSDQNHRNILSTLKCTQTEINIRTPDNKNIKGSLICPQGTSLSDPVVIFAQPNASVSVESTFIDTMQEIIKLNKKCNFILFDYRGSGFSKGSLLQAKDLVLDLDSVYMFAKEQLKIPTQDIHMMGFSLGGAVTSQVKAMHPECTGNTVIDRSFSNIIDIASSLVKKNAIISFLARHVLRLLGWGWLNSTEAFKKIKSPSLILHHPKDYIIKEEFQLQRTIDTRQRNIQTINLNNLNWAPCDNFHCVPLSMFIYERNTVSSAVAKFLTQKPK